jgi:peptidoglycan hydrolase CwlO-like protein
MTIFGLSITKKSYVDSLEEEIYDLIGRFASVATKVAELQSSVDALMATHDEYEAEINALKTELEPIKAFMKEHGKNILEAEEEYNRQQRAISDGIQSIANYSPLSAMKKGDK